MRVKKSISKSGGTLALVSLLSVSTAQAEIKDYEMRRFITYKTECNLDNIVKETRDDGGVNFLATCQNQTTYPEGLLISCSDGDDAYSCKVKTEPVSFELKHLQ